jgi:hypothetical protein
MRPIFRRLLATSIFAALSFVLMTMSASAHEHRVVAGHSMVVGWLDEPTYAGFKNGVQVFLNEPPRKGEEEGAPVDDASLEVEVLFGAEDAEESVGPLPLEPAFGRPSEYNATVIPTRPGQYTFHITGTIDDQDVDEFFTSGPNTFSEVGDPAEVEFPVQDPSRGQLAEAVQGAQDQADELRSTVEDVQEAADTARLLAILGLVVGVIGLVIAGAAFARRRPATP